MPENDSFVGDMTAVTFVRQMAELSGLPPKAALEQAHEVLFHVGLGESRYRELRTYSLRDEADGQARAGDRARAGAGRAGRTDQRARSCRAPADAQAHRRDEGGAGDARARLLPPAARHRAGVRRGRDPEGRRDRAPLQPRRRAPVEPALRRARGDAATIGTSDVRCRRSAPRACPKAAGAGASCCRRMSRSKPSGRSRRGKIFWSGSLTHRRDTLEEIFLKAMGHLSPSSQPPAPSSQQEAGS